MQKKTGRKIISLLLAAVLCFTLSAGFGITSYAATDVTEEVYLVDYPRGGDANFNVGDWGYGNLTFKNDWSINEDGYGSEKVEELLLLLAKRLSKISGKKQYGYLKSDVKAIVNAIVTELSTDERIAALYDLWYEKREEILLTYTQELPKRILLCDNKEFKSIKNTVIQEAMKLSLEQAEAEEKTRCHGKNPSVMMCSFQLLRHLAALLQERTEGRRNEQRAVIDRKLKRKIEEKKQAHGLRQGG